VKREDDEDEKRKRSRRERRLRARIAQGAAHGARLDEVDAALLLEPVERVGACARTAVERSTTGRSSNRRTATEARCALAGAPSVKARASMLP